MSRLVLSLLGSVSVTLDDASVQLPTKAMALLVYVAVESGRAHRREDLATLLWPDSPEAKGRHNLRQTLTVLRQRLGLDQTGAPFLRMTRGTVAFDRRSNHRIDLHEMLTPLQCPQGADSRGACRSGCFTRAALHRGPFLEDLSLAESETFAHWIVVQREMVDRKAAQMLERLYDCYAEEDRQAALPVLRRQLELDPWNENVHRELMRVLSLGGENNAAIRHFNDFARRIRAELGVEPEEETSALYETICANRGRWPQSRPQIVLVEGERPTRAMTATFLRKNGFDVHEAEGAAACLAIVKRGPMDAVVTDVKLADGDGIALAAELRQVSEIGIIFLSARGAPRDRVAGLDAGADDYLVKPAHLPELAARLRSVLRRRG